MKYYVISDTHFGHENIIRYCNRPFSSVEEMDKTLIKNWNQTVSNKDIVLHLGDVGLCKKDYLAEIISKLNGKKILIKGNHDNFNDQFYRDAGFSYVSQYPILYKEFYLLSHEPVIMMQNDCRFNCYGHVHNDPVYQNTPNSECFCVERIGYRPKLLFEG